MEPRKEFGVNVASLPDNRIRAGSYGADTLPAAILGHVPRKPKKMLDSLGMFCSISLSLEKRRGWRLICVSDCVFVQKSRRIQ